MNSEPGDYLLSRNGTAFFKVKKLNSTHITLEYVAYFLNSQIIKQDELIEEEYSIYVCEYLKPLPKHLEQQLLKILIFA